jgi:two-component system cell cycle response regulator DivK
MLKSSVVLIAEDDDSNSFFLQKILKSESVSILLAINGEEAVEQCRKHPEISLVLMDIKMPVMDGLEATRQIKSFRKDLPVIAITAFAMTGDKKRALEAGCDDYMAKPVGKDDLLAKFRKHGL